MTPTTGIARQARPDRNDKRHQVRTDERSELAPTSVGRIAPTSVKEIAPCYTPVTLDVFPRSNHWQVPHPVFTRQRRLRYGLPCRRHVDRQKSRAEGSS